MVTRAAESQDFDALLASWAEKVRSYGIGVSISGYRPSCEGCAGVLRVA
jgi:hypothetical protein